MLTDDDFLLTFPVHNSTPTDLSFNIRVSTYAAQPAPVIWRDERTNPIHTRQQ